MIDISLYLFFLSTPRLFVSLSCECLHLHAKHAITARPTTNEATTNQGPRGRPDARAHGPEPHQKDQGRHGRVVLDAHEAEDLGQVTPAGADEEEPRGPEDGAVEASPRRAGHEDRDGPRHDPEGALAEGLSGRGKVSERGGQ